MSEEATQPQRKLFPFEQRSQAGKARLVKISPERRKEIARVAAKRRWAETPAEIRGLPKATHSGELRLGGVTIPCYVLKDGRRILTQRGMAQALGLSDGGGRNPESLKMADFLGSKSLKSSVSDELMNRSKSSFRFLTGRGGKVSEGLEATILPEICAPIVEAYIAGKLFKSQVHIGERCATLVLGMAKVGIIALIDEATGYQTEREREALQILLDRYVAPELRPWTKRFPDEFYRLIFKLNGWSFRGGVRRPRLIARYTHDLIYARLPPPVLERLKTLNPPDEFGRRKNKHHQSLSIDLGQPELEKLITSAIVLMKSVNTWQAFLRLMERVYPTRQQLMLPLPEEAA